MASTARPADRIRVRRNPKKGRYEPATVEAILDRGLVAHIAFVDHGDPMPPNAKERKATTILAMPMKQASAKVRYGPPDDDDSDDATLDIWAGEIPILTTLGEPVPSPGLRTGILIPASIHALLSARGSRHRPGAPQTTLRTTTLNARQRGPFARRPRGAVGVGPAPTGGQLAEIVFRRARRGHLATA